MLAAIQLASTTDSHESRWEWRLAPWAVLVGMFIATTGCDQASQNVVERVGVTGRVTLDGRPLEAGAIVFHSTSRLTGTAGATGASGVTEPQENRDSIIAFAFVENGAYAINAESGPAMGISRVEFRSKPVDRGEFEDAIDQAAKPNGRRPPPTSVVAIPDIYGTESMLRVDLSAGENQRNFELKSKPPY